MIHRCRVHLLPGPAAAINHSKPGRAGALSRMVPDSPTRMTHSEDHRRLLDTPLAAQGVARDLIRRFEPDSARRGAGANPSLDSTPLRAKRAPGRGHVTARSNDGPR